MFYSDSRHLLCASALIAWASLSALLAGQATAAPAERTTAGDVVLYRRGDAVPQSQLADLGRPEDLGGTVLEGDPRISARIDFADGAFTAGVFQATRGKVLIHFPFTEHATILAGAVELTDGSGVQVTLHPGDSYLISQGSDILWEVRGALVQKSFANRVEDHDSPGLMRIYRARRAVEDGQLVEIGPPEVLGGVTLEGQPVVSARFDLPDASAGVMAVSDGTLRVDFAFAAHAAVTSGRLRVTDPTGCVHLLQPGDAYFVRPRARVLWQVGEASVQQSFFHTVLTSAPPSP